MISDYADLLAKAAGFDATGALLAGVVATASVVDDGIRLRLPGSSGHFESARLWAALIGPPGSGKTPSQKPMLAPIYELHRTLFDQSERQRHAAEKDAPVPRLALFSSDATVDKLSDVLRDNPRGILYAVDELDSWLGAHDAFSRDGGSRARGEWLRLYDGGPHQVDRVGRGSFFVKNWGASLLTATTPTALRRLSKKLSNDGLFQRILVFGITRTRPRDPSIPWLLVEGARKRYEDRLAAIFHLSAALVTPAVVHLSHQAAAALEAEEIALRALVEAAESHGESFASHIAKHYAMLARVTLTFHAASDDLLSDDGTPRHPCFVPVS